MIMVISNKKNKNNSKEFKELRMELSSMLMQTREELNKNIGTRIAETANIQQTSLANLTNINETKLDNIRKAVEDNLSKIQRDNNDKLEKMRITVDEKLQGTLEKRLGESFKLVNDRLESVYKGLGEMQNLAQGVGDLKKVFSNVKSRGYWGEVQLSAILEQFLTNEQYDKNVKTKPNTNELVEFAIKLPGKNDNEFVWLPVDSKFPIEDYSRLVDAQDIGDVSLVN